MAEGLKWMINVDPNAEISLFHHETPLRSREDWEREGKPPRLSPK